MIELHLQLLLNFCSSFKYFSHLFNLQRMYSFLNLVAATLMYFPFLLSFSSSAAEALSFIFIFILFFNYDGDATDMESAQQPMEMRRARVRRPSSGYPRNAPWYFLSLRGHIGVSSK